jgi:hypothetical protein
MPLDAFPVRDLGGQNDLDCDVGKFGFQLSTIISQS